MKYYTIVDTATLNSTLPEVIKEKMEYTEDYTLADVVFSKRELTNGNWLISVQLTPNIYFGRNVQSLIKEEDLELAKLQYGEENIITHEEYLSLDFKEIEE